MHARSTACCRSTARTSSCCAIRLRRRISTTRQSSPRSTTPNASSWRPIAGPLLRSPLALRDAETLEAENLYPDRTGETYAITYNPNQRGRSYGQDLRDTMSVAIDRGLDPKAGSTGIQGERTVALQYVDDVAKPRRDDANASRAWIHSPLSIRFASASYFSARTATESRSAFSVSNAANPRKCAACRRRVAGSICGKTPDRITDGPAPEGPWFGSVENSTGRASAWSEKGASENDP